MPNFDSSMNPVMIDTNDVKNAVVDRTEVFPVYVPDTEPADTSTPDVRKTSSNPDDPPLCGTTRLFSVFYTRRSVATFSDESVARANDGQAATLSTSSSFLPDKRHKAGVG